MAAAGAIYAIASVLDRLDRDARKPVGSWIMWLSVSLVITLFCVDRLFHQVDISYGAIAVVLASGGALWLVLRLSSETPDRASPRDSLLVLQAAALLIVLLWLIQSAFEPYKPDFGDRSALLATFAGAGLLAMAAVQGLRTLLPLRGVFHRLTLERWVADAIRDDAPESKDPRQILDTVIRLSRGPVAGDRYSLLDLPIEQLCGQIAAGADRLLDEPFPETLKTKGSAKAPADIKDVLMALAAGGRDVDAYIALAESLRARKPTQMDSTSDSLEYARLRTNLSQRIQRNIDGLQITTTFWWRRVLRGLAFTICGVLGLSAFRGDLTASLLCAVVGGFVSTASRDLVAVIEKLRR